MRQFSETDVQKTLKMPDCIELMREVFAALSRGEAQNQPRRRLILPTQAVLHQLAGAYGGYFGTKVYATHPQNPPHFTVLLYEAANAKPVAQFEANILGQIRTGAVSGLAIDLFADPEAQRLAIIGSGFQAQTQLEAAMCVRPFREVAVWSRDAAKRDAFAKSSQERYGLAARAAESAAEAARGAQVVITATSAREPVLKADDLASGALICAMGSNNPQRRELGGDTLRRADLLVVDSVEQARAEAGEFLLGLGEAGKGWDGIRELAEYVPGHSAYRYDPARIVVFKSLGLGVEDVAAAAWIHERQATPAP